MLRAMFWSVTNLLSIQSTLIITSGAVLAVAGGVLRHGPAAGAGEGRLRQPLAEALAARLEGRGLAGADRRSRPGHGLAGGHRGGGRAGARIHRLRGRRRRPARPRRQPALGHDRPPRGAAPDPASRARQRRGHRRRRAPCCSSAGCPSSGTCGRRRRSTRGCPQQGCNKHLELCDRTLDRVVFAGTHNSMSAPSELRLVLIAHQSGGILAQLSKGVRAFLIDLHYGSQVQGTRPHRSRRPRVSWPPSRPTSPLQAVAQANGIMDMFGGCRTGVGAQAVPLPQLLRARCHAGPSTRSGRSATGWPRTRTRSSSSTSRTTSPARTPCAELAEVGPGRPRLHLDARHPDADARPHDRDEAQRADHGRVPWRAPAPWYLDAYKSVLQETPYRFTSQAEFSCAREARARHEPALPRQPLDRERLRRTPPSPKR